MITINSINPFNYFPTISIWLCNIRKVYFHPWKVTLGKLGAWRVASVTGWLTAVAGAVPSCRQNISTYAPITCATRECDSGVVIPNVEDSYL